MASLDGMLKGYSQEMRCKASVSPWLGCTHHSNDGCFRIVNEYLGGADTLTSMHIKDPPRMHLWIAKRISTESTIKVLDR
jgi:hypothetical protein